MRRRGQGGAEAEAEAAVVAGDAAWAVHIPLPPLGPNHLLPQRWRRRRLDHTSQTATHLRFCRPNDRLASKYMNPLLPMPSLGNLKNLTPTRRHKSTNSPQETHVLAEAALRQPQIHLLNHRQLKTHVRRLCLSKRHLNPKGSLAIPSQPGHLYFVA